MMVSASKGYAFVSCPKCATFTIYDVLSSQCDGTRVGAFHNRSLPAQFADGFVFGVVRNPYARAVSLWNVVTNDIGERVKTGHAARLYQRFAGASVAEFFEWMALGLDIAARKLWCSMTAWYRGISIERFVRVETLSEDLNALPFVRTRLEVPRLHGFAHQDWRELMENGAAHAAVEKWAGQDFETFGYERLGRVGVAT